MVEVEKPLSDFFKSKGFKKKGKCWYSDNGENYILCEYQKSKYGDGFYLNFGIVFKELYHESTFPARSYSWHFCGRYFRVIGIEDKSVIDVDDKAGFKMDEIFSNIDSIVLPFLNKVVGWEYLHENFPENFPHERLWIQNISSNDLVKFVSSKL